MVRMSNSYNTYKRCICILFLHLSTPISRYILHEIRTQSCLKQRSDDYGDIDSYLLSRLRTPMRADILLSCGGNYKSFLNCTPSRGAACQLNLRRFLSQVANLNPILLLALSFTICFELPGNHSSLYVT